MEPENSNFKVLSDAGLITSEYEFSSADRALIEKLSPEEVTALISTARKLGRDFLMKHSPHGLLF